MTAFDNSFSQLIGNEGGYSNNPHDAGGETMWGITSRVARENGYLGDMKELPLQTAKDIARKIYWDPFHCDGLPEELAFQVFDTAYNGGKPILWLQQSVGVLADGHIGPSTLKAAQTCDVSKAIMKFNSLRLQYYTGLSSWGYFGKGWVNRIANNLMRAAQ